MFYLIPRCGVVDLLKAIPYQTSQKKQAGLQVLWQSVGRAWSRAGHFSILQTAWEPHNISYIQQINWRKGSSGDSAEMRSQNSSGKLFPASCYPALCSSASLLPVTWSHHGTTRELSALKTRGWLPHAWFIGQRGWWALKEGCLE